MSDDIPYPIKIENHSFPYIRTKCVLTFGLIVLKLYCVRPSDAVIDIFEEEMNEI